MMRHPPQCIRQTAKLYSAALGIADGTLDLRTVFERNDRRHANRLLRHRRNRCGMSSKGQSRSKQCSRRDQNALHVFLSYSRELRLRRHRYLVPTRGYHEPVRLHHVNPTTSSKCFLNATKRRKIKPIPVNQQSTQAILQVFPQ